MRIAMVTRRFWPLVGEPEYVAANLAESLHEKQHEVKVLSSRSFPGWPAHFQFRGFPVLRLPLKFPAFRVRRHFERAVLRHIREQQDNLDAVFFFQSGHPQFDLIHRINRYGIRCIVRLEPTSLGHADISAIDIETLISIHKSLPSPGRFKFVTGSRLFAEQLRRIGVSIEHVPDGVPSSSLESQMIDPKDAGQFEITDKKQLAKVDLSRSHPLLRIRSKEKLLLFAGQITPSQRLDHWISCFKKIRKALPATKLWIVGEGNIQQQLWEQIIDLELDDHVIMGGVFDELASIYEAADGFLLGDPRRVDSPFVLLAQSRGLPIITSFGNSEALKQSDSPSVIDASCETSRTEHHVLVDILDGATDINKILESARTKIATSHTMDACTQAYLNIVQAMD